MERRSTRGRQSVDTAPAAVATTPVSAGAIPSSSSTSAASTTPTVVAADAVPEVGVEEVVLNRRGMPARQRKRNRFYFDDDNMITSDTSLRKSLSKSPVKKVKQDTEERDSSSRGKGSSPATKGRAESSSKGSAVKESPRGSNSESYRGRGGDVSPVKSNRNAQSPPKVPIPIKIKKDPDAIPTKATPTPRVEKEREVETTRVTPSRAKTSVSPPKVPQPIKIKKDPDASPKVVSKPDKEREKERTQQEKQREKEKAKERDRLMKEKEKKEARKEKEKAKERDRDYAVPAKRNRRGSSPSQYSGNRATSPEAVSDMPRPAIDKKTAQDISLRLRNVLKLPKAHKWVCYEWFYSNIDKVLFEGENDFQICLKESFPTLKARKMTRVEWCKIRRMMGKPRRCSQAFFDEEREELARRRQKIRMIQQRKITDFNYKELPDEIPLQLTIGTKVTARLRRPQDGLFTGTIEGVDTSNNTYRITFDRSGLGTHSIPDYEVLSNDNPETVSTSSFALKIPRRSYSGFAAGNFKFSGAGFMSEDGVGGMPKSPFPVDGMLGGFPIRLLDMIVRLSKLLKAKREKILQLKELNVEAEKMFSYSKSVNNDYRMRYARCVLDLDSMNKEMSMYLEGIQQYCLDIAPDHGANQMIIPEHVQEQARQEALLIVDTFNTKQNRNLLHNSKNLGLIAQLTSLLLQIKTLGTGERNLYELKSIKDTVKEIKASLEGRNVVLFQNRIEIPVNQIQAGLCGSAYPVKGAF